MLQVKYMIKVEQKLVMKQLGQIIHTKKSSGNEKNLNKSVLQTPVGTINFASVMKIFSDDKNNTIGEILIFSVLIILIVLMFFKLQLIFVDYELTLLQLLIFVSSLLNRL